MPTKTPSTPEPLVRHDGAGKRHKCISTRVRKFRAKYGWNSDLTSSTVKRVIEKFKQTGLIDDAKHTGHPKTNRSNVNMEAVPESVGESPGT
ncbi:52 kDa repressor of the inhibitor of the protein kinase [Nephila pilipes]|uniref:52 kDa repressor of the inhibitor of the protein kinase n=1 Tax=Nephila pilipes TaxID=299642 RepID=A0A8X6JMP2_NEPPI|nr:52 kDa repressor of the inhibitor of the protein kinase [Nephila pilipes]